MPATNDVSRWSVRPGSDEHAQYFARYIGRVPDDALESLRTSLEETIAVVRDIPEDQTARGYAEGKWSVREVMLHLADAERVFAYRALRFARGDSTPLASFDENSWTPASQANQRSMTSILGELRAVRAATIAFVEGLPEGAEIRRGTASGNPMSVRALVWIAAGHELHHRTVLEERYLPVLTTQERALTGRRGAR
jgi:uncharacterized damage-inducible protein DinB